MKKEDEDIFNVTPEKAALAAQSQAEQDSSGDQQNDPTMWKPALKKGVDSYQAKIRLLPQGMAGLKSNKLPSVHYMVHYLKDAKSKAFKNVICKKTITGEKGKCPICDAIWDKYNEAKKRTSDAKNDPDCKEQIRNLSTKRHVANILIVKDKNHPELDGSVLKWDHTDKINTDLTKPYWNSAKVDDTADVKGDDDDDFKQEQDTFNPYSPQGGRNRVVVVVPDPKKKSDGGRAMPDYEGSFWEKNPSDIAPTNEGIIAILDKCHDLTKYREVPSDEVLMAEYADFIEQIARKNREAANAAGAKGTARPATGGNDAALNKNAPANVNAQEYLGGGKQSRATSEEVTDDPFTIGTPSTSGDATDYDASDFSAPLDSGADDNLPF
jgi:hypothetical protein